MTKKVKAMLLSTDKELVILGFSLLLEEEIEKHFYLKLNVSRVFDYHDMYVKNGMAIIVPSITMHVRKEKEWLEIFKKFGIEANIINL